MCRLALGMECHVVRSRTQWFDTPSKGGSSYVLRGAICVLSEAISGYAASITPHRSQDLQWWAITLYFCLTDKRKSLAPLLTLWLLIRESEHLFLLALPSPARPSTHNKAEQVPGEVCRFYSYSWSFHKFCLQLFFSYLRIFFASKLLRKQSC